MHAFKMLRKIGGFLNLRAAHLSSPAYSFSFARTLPAFLVPPLDPSRRIRSGQRPSFAPRALLDAYDNNVGGFQTNMFSSDTSPTPEIISDSSWDDYENFMLYVMKNFAPRPHKKVTEAGLEKIKSYLFSRNVINATPLVMENGMKSHQLRKVMDERKGFFINATGFTEHEYDFAMRCLVTLGLNCAKKQKPEPMPVAWRKIKEAGLVPKQNFANNFIYVLSLDEKYIVDSAELATFHDVLFEPTETGIYLQIKACLANNDIQSAEMLLKKLPDDAGKKEGKRLRTYLPVLNYYCDIGDAPSILRLWKQMNASPGTHLDAEAYALIVGSLARYGCFKPGAEAIPCLEELGIVTTGGPDLLDQLCNTMADDIVELTEAAALSLYNAFTAGFSGEQPYNPVPEIPSYGDGSERSSAFGRPGLIAGRVAVDNNTAICPLTGTKLRLFLLDKDQRQHVHSTLIRMAATQHEDFVGSQFHKQSKVNSTRAQAELRSFGDWLESRTGEPYTAFVDGANVAYFGHGAFRYSNVLKVVEELERMGENPLVIMPQKYASASFRLSNGSTQKLTNRSLEAMTQLITNRKMFIVPPLCFDDYYWMLASVSKQNTTDGTFHVPANAAFERFPGARPLLISNDQMRDHKLELLEPRLFRRWYSCHIVEYAIAPFEENEWEDRQVKFSPADFFSREIQGNAIGHNVAAGTSWHFPVKEWESKEEWFCIAVER